MQKLELNKTTVSQMEQEEMSKVIGGGLCLKFRSCKRGSRKGLPCCQKDPPPIIIDSIN